jgi:nicotinate-nucleotide pyrophosphorylase (carboxylating)
MSTQYLENIETTVSHALAEDLGSGDITASLIDAAQESTAQVFTREAAIICGRPWVDEVFKQIDPAVDLAWEVREGEAVRADTVLFQAQGKTRSLLTAERTALNFLQTLSATASQTHRLVQLVKHTKTSLLDTRKTIPGLRLAQKYAVATGGGVNHRIGLYDAFLIKENHIRGCGSIANAISRARELAPEARLEVEVETFTELREAIDAGPDWIMLDNFSIADTKRAVAETNSAVKLEASGGIENDDDLVKIAETGVDYISIGAMTKHCRAIDLSMLLS